MLSPGDKIGSYTIRETAGAGGMATVYKAWHEGLHRNEALKVPRGAGDGAADSAYVLRLLSEARVAARLHHPNIVAIHNVSEVDANVPFFAMDWVDGEDLSQVLKLRKQLSLQTTIEILHPVAHALDYAHSQNVVHRDVKPANILLEYKNDKWVPHVVDFGISRAAEDEDGATKLTKSGMLVGTPEYMSPEQAGSGEVVDYRTDIYSLGVVAYEMLCGTPPFTAGEGVSRLSILIAHVGKEAPLFQIRPDFPKEIGNVLLHALAKSPGARPQSCVEFIENLKAVAAGTPNDTLLPLLASPKDVRTPFDASRFDIDNDATLIQRLGDSVPAAQSVASSGNLQVPVSTPTSEPVSSPETLSAEVHQPLVTEVAQFESVTETQPEPLETAPLPVEEPVKSTTKPIEQTAVTAPVQTSTERPIKKAGVPKAALLVGGAMLLIVGAGTIASMSMKRLQLSPTTDPAIEKPTPQVSISKPTVITEKQPKSTTRTMRVTRMREIPFETETRRSRRRYAGQTAIIQAGRPGTREIVLSITMDGEREVARTKVSERDVLQPVNQIIEIGTRQKVAIRRSRVRSVSDSTRGKQSSRPAAKPVKKAPAQSSHTPPRSPVREAPLPP